MSPPPWITTLTGLLSLAVCPTSLGRRLEPHHLVAEFRQTGSQNLSHIAIDPHTGHVFVAGSNVIYNLDEELRQVHRVETGPVLDSHMCGASGCGMEKNSSLRLTNNYNKVLVVDGSHAELIACGSIRQGSCNKYQLQDISMPPETILEAVAANNQHSSTFGFIGPQRYNPWSNSDVLYVGTTFTSHGDYRHDVPAIASRNLYDLKFAEWSFSKQSLLRIDRKYRDHFLVDYVHGFNTSTHVYFVTVQKKSYLPGDQETGYITRISRSCIQDSNFVTYSEVTLECHGSGENFNLVQSATVVPASEALAADLEVDVGDQILIGVFSPSVGYTAKPKKQSAMCAYSLPYVDKLFDQNIHMCFNGTMQHRNLPYISGPIDEGRCPTAGTSGNIFSFCEVALKISGPSPILSQISLSLPRGSLATAITATNVGGNTMAIVGSDSGSIFKILVTSGQAAIIDSFQVAAGEPILQGTSMHSNNLDLLVLTPRRVIRLKIASCSHLTFCGECLSNRDPFCGWCSLQNECTVLDDCRGGGSSPSWLSLGARHQCIHLENITPSYVAVAEHTNISLQISALPDLPLSDHYQCVYDGHYSLKATRVAGGLECPTLPVDSRPPIPSNSDHVTVNLAITSRHAKKEFVSTNIMLFNCDMHTTCLDCVSSLWPCSWCIYGNRCTHLSSTRDTCKEAIVSGDTSIFQLLQDNPSQLISRGKQYCPRVEVTSQIVIPNNVPQELSLAIANLPDLSQYIGNTNFLCQVEIEAAKFRVPARLDDNMVICDRTTFSYESAVSQYNATISVIWNDDNIIDRTNITLYKCSLVGSYKGHPDCSLCMARAADMGCVWCGSGCQYTKNCLIGQSYSCPQPRIDVVKPLSGPIDGGTTITIEGSNLATGLSQLKGKVSVGSIPCKVINYQVSVKIECKTSKVRGPVELPVQLLGDNGIIESIVKFRYRDIEIHNVKPSFGPVSGGTLVAIEGVNLNIGSSIQVFLDNLKCRVNLSQVSSTRITCVTSPAHAPGKVKKLIVVIDDATRSLALPYTYKADPTILEVKPKWSFLSGGRVLTVHGSNLNTVDQPYITALDDRGIAVSRSPCHVITSQRMDCPSPAIVSAAQLAGPMQEGQARLQDRGKITPVRVGFEMDSVKSVLNLKREKSEILYVEDPIYYNFKHNEKNYKGEGLVIEGYNLNLASDESDLDVRIGEGRCNVTSLTATQMLCIPPITPPKPLTSNHPEVVVYVGKNLKFEIGLLRYDIGSGYAVPPEVIGGIGAAAALTLFIAIAFMIIYKHKSSQAEREYKRIQIQMDTLENNVRSECKQAFAELQTDMTDLTMELESSGIPLLDHRTFVMKVFFPGVGDHPLFVDPRIHGVSKPKTDLDSAMLQFEQLINNKWFLLSFIETVEKQKSFTIRDRVNFASLLTVILMTKMEYCTDILRSLLMKLVEKSLSSKHPQLMLRRTESIVEKMLTNWLALCLYDYLKDYAGSSLFVLFKAIKFQVEKGPVDVCTHDARYSLAEDRLLREAVSANIVICCIVQDELDEDIVVKVLDCDAISQVKAKILDAVYKNTPYSLRPGLDEVDLEWRCGQYSQLGTPSGHIVLQDIDITCKVDQAGWRKVNTLQHYGVKEKAIMSLVPKQIDSPSHHIYQCVGVVGRGESEYASSPSHVEGATLAGYGGPASYSGTHSTPSYSVQPVYERGFGTSRGGAYSGYNTHSNNPKQLSNDQFLGLSTANLYHLVRPDHLHDIPTDANLSRTHKSIPEIFLTRLLSTKGTIQKFVDDFFGTILKVPESFPPPVKWLFDILDEASLEHNVSDVEVLHAWKSNCLPLRFWVNFIKNPDFIFDVNKTVTTDSCLSVIAQTFMDSCSLNENILGKDSPSSKLLFAKDIPLYRELVVQFYKNIQNIPQVSDQEVNFHLHQLSLSHMGEFDSLAGLKELYIYVYKYYGEIMEALEDNFVCKKMGLQHKLKSIVLSVNPGQL